MALPFPSIHAAKACVDYVTKRNRSDGKDTLLVEDISIQVFSVGSKIAVVFFPQSRTPHVVPFWQNTGTGISSRQAEEALNHMNHIQDLSAENSVQISTEDGPTHELLSRIAGLLNRARASGKPQVSQEDVYLFQTGMTAIFYVHSFLSKWQPNVNSKVVQLGVPFHQTTNIFSWWGPGLQFFPAVTELDALEDYLKVELAASRPVKTVWTEVPTNPLLTTPDLLRLRELANKYRFVVIVDDTVGSFCNVDVLDFADIVLTSLTKSFSGYADVMGGSAVLSKASPVYSELTAIFQTEYHNDVFTADILTLLHNSADYMQRSSILNSNAKRLVEYLHSTISDPDSSVTTVFYPTLSTTNASYDALKRPETGDFVPGYGSLFSIDFGSLEETIAFYNNLHFHHGPHLGAHRTIALAYVKAAYSEKIPEGENWGMQDTQIRIAVGLEDFDTLLATFKHALKFSSAVKLGRK
jgi:cystathionine gamma-synthase